MLQCSRYAAPRDARSATMKFVFLPPQTEHTRALAETLATELPTMHVVVPADDGAARREIVDADAAYGTLAPEALRNASRLRWLQAPAAAPAAGYYYPE